MVATSSRVRLVPASFLDGASCLLELPARPAGIVTPFEGARPRQIDALTPAEQRVCELMLQGCSNKEISSLLGRAEATIKNQVASVLRKHHVPSRARLIALLR